MSNIKFISKYSILTCMYEHLELLEYIAKNGGLFGSLKSSTSKISKELKISQQTISRKFRVMEQKGLIERFASPNGITASINDKGRELLQINYRELRCIFKSKKTKISGILQKGIGEGAYYVSQMEYQKQFRDKLGFSAFHGTLNLKINKEELIRFIANKAPIKINGFETKTRSFGYLTCYKIKIRDNLNAAIVKAERARHPEDIIEIIADVNLRDSLKLNDGDNVKIS